MVSLVASGLIHGLTGPRYEIYTREAKDPARRQNLHRMFSVLRCRLRARCANAERILRLQLLSTLTLNGHRLPVPCSACRF